MQGTQPPDGTGEPQLVPTELIERRIHVIRGYKIMLDSDLAAVQRNRERFPSDFMFPLENQEVKNLRFQIGTSSFHGGQRYRSYAFTQEGIAMLSSVLRSERAIQVNIAIMRTFVQLRQLLSSNAVLAAKLEELEQKVGSHDQAIVGIFKMLQGLMNPPRVNAIGFTADFGKKS